MADAANRSRGSGRRVRGAFVPDVRCGYRNPTLSSILATQIPCRSCRSGAQAARRELCGVAITAGCKNGTPCRAASLRCCYSFYYIICFARVNGYFDDYYAVISSLLFTLFLCRFFSFHPSSLHPGIPAHLPSFSPIIPRAIPHNSKCRYGERGAAAVGAVLKPLGGNCAVLPKVYLKSKNAGYFHFSAAPQQKSSGQQSASRCSPYYNSASGVSAPLHLNYSSLSSGISSSKASIQLSLCHLSFSPFSLAATFCRCAWSFIMVPIGFSARSSIMW